MKTDQTLVREAEMAKQRSYSRRTFLLAAALVVFVLALYAPALRCGFLNYDDDLYVTSNAHVSQGVTAEGLRWAMASTTEASLWQPATWASHMLDVSMFGMNPAGHHASSVLLHASNSVLLFLILSWMTGSSGLSLMVAALFAVHPLNVENVVWIAERKTLVSTFFTLLAVAAYARYARRLNAKWYAAMLALFALALMAKATAVTLPAMLLVLDWWPLERVAGADGVGRLEAPKQSVAKLIAEKLLMLPLSLVCAWINFKAQSHSGAVVQFPLGQRLGHAVWSLVAYIVKMIAPTKLAIMYPYLGADPAWKVALAAVVVVLFAVVCLVWKSERYLATGVLWYGIGMLPVIGIIHAGHQSLSDHYLYAPIIGVFVTAIWGARRLLERVNVSHGAQIAIAIAVVLGYSAATAAYLPTWKNSSTVFANAARISTSPDVLIENNLAEGLAELGHHEEAVPHYRKSISLAPAVALPHYNLGNSLLATGKAAEAVAEFREALRLSREPGLTLRCLHNLGAAYANLEDWAQAEQAYSAALAMAPENEMTLMGRGYARLQAGRFKDAADDLAHLARVKPSSAAFYLLGKALAGEGLVDQAIAAEAEAVRIAPEMREAQEELHRLQATQQAH